MLLIISKLQKEHMKLLQAQSTQVLVDFCKLAIDYLNNGMNEKKYQVAAEKLHASYDNIQNIIYAVVYLLKEGCKHNLSDSDFKASLAIAEFNNDQQEVLAKLYETKRPELLKALQKLHNKDVTLQNVSWRFEVEVAGMNNSEVIKPLVTLNLVLQTCKCINLENLTLDSKSKDVAKGQTSSCICHDIENSKTASECQNIITNVFLQADLPNLINITNKLDQALKESKSHHVRKVQRTLQR